MGAVRTVRPGEAAETLPAASRAVTTKVYGVSGVSPVTVYVVPVALPTFTGPAVSTRCTS